jgi:dihydroorotase
MPIADPQHPRSVLDSKSAGHVGPGVEIGQTLEHLEIDDAWIVDPTSGFEGRGGLTIEGGVVTEVRRDADAGGPPPSIVVAPGFVDLHAHVREPQGTDSEDFSTALAAAAHGGFTWLASLADMRTIVDRAEVVQRVRAAGAASDTPIGTRPYGALTVGQEGKTIAPLASLAAAGVVGFSDDPKPVGDSAVLRAALTEAGSLRLPVVVNADEPSFTSGAEANEGLPATILGLHGASTAAEVGAVARAIAVLRQVTAEAPPDVRPHLHLAHLSTAESLATVRAAAREGLHVTCDVTAHHLCLHDGWIGGDRRYSWAAATAPWSGEPGEAAPYASATRVDPPLRGPEDAIALLAGVEDGTITSIATDHSPWPSVDQDVPFGDAKAGMTSLETTLGLLLEAVAAGRLSLRRVLRALTVGPWRVLDGSRHGIPEPGIREGSAANLVVFDRSERWRVTAESLRSRGRNTPLLGRELPGRVLVTVSGGRVAHIGGLEEE